VVGRRARVGTPLQRGDVLGILAPAAAIEPARFKRALDFIHSQGFKTKVALDPTAAYGKVEYLFSSDAPKARAKAMHQLFRDKSVRAILSVRGAYGSMEILPLLDFSLIKRHPKIFVGISDVTALLVNLYEKSGITAVHGPSVDSMSRAGESESARRSAEMLFRLLCGETVRPFEGVELFPLRRKAKVTAPLIVGNVSMFSALMGTPFEARFDGHIVCFEELAERPFKVHRMLLQMKLAGMFKAVRAVVLGSFKDCVHPRGLGPGLQDVFDDIFRDQKIPVIAGAPFGHDEDNRPLPFGVPVQLTSSSLELLAPLGVRKR
jgi:muramoyltetrapeptide carboxypeptidase